MGPPSGVPYAVVSATNLSKQGVFIDADRPVRVGARFSAEIPLRDGDRLYVPQVEVVYNRDHRTGTGFGARFVEIAPEMLEKLDREIGLTLPPGAPTDPQSAAPPHEEETSEEGPPLPQVLVAEEEGSKTEIVKLDTEGRRPPIPRITVDVTKLPEPIIPDDLAVDTSFPETKKKTAPKNRARAKLEELMIRAKEARRDMIEGARRYPGLWIATSLVGLLAVLGAGALAFYKTPEKESAEPHVSSKDRGISATTQQVLMGEKQVPVTVQTSARGGVEDGAENKDEAKKPLPPLVFIDDAQKTLEKMIRVQTDEVPPQSRTAKKTEKAEKPEKKKAAKPAPETGGSHESVAKKAIEKATRISERARAVLTSAVRPPKSPKVSKLKIELSPKAQVLKTHVFKAPHRFVVDLIGQPSAPALPAPSGHVTQVRFGKHPEFSRLVVETDAPIENGRASKSAQKLELTIDYQE